MPNEGASQKAKGRTDKQELEEELNYEHRYYQESEPRASVDTQRSYGSMSTVHQVPSYHERRPSHPTILGAVGDFFFPRFLK